MSDAQNQPVFSIEKVFVKDISLEIPNAPQVFLEREAPTVDIQLHHNSDQVEDGVYQTVAHRDGDREGRRTRPCSSSRRARPASS